MDILPTTESSYQHDDANDEMDSDGKDSNEEAPQKSPRKQVKYSSATMVAT
jgi:hypothetical protein